MLVMGAVPLIVTGCAETEEPAWFLPSVAWSFSEPVVEGELAFIAAVRAYSEDIGSSLADDELDAVLPDRTLFVLFETAEEAGFGSRTVKREVRIESPNALNAAQLLHRVHLRVHRHFLDQDKHFFEGFLRTGRRTSDGVAIYEVHLGS